MKFASHCLQRAMACDGGKRMAAAMTVAGAGVKPAAAGDDAYHFIAVSQAGLPVRKACRKDRDRLALAA